MSNEQLLALLAAADAAAVAVVLASFMATTGTIFIFVRFAAHEPVQHEYQLE